MEFEKLQKIIAEVLNLSEEEIRPDSTFVDDLGADSLDVFQIIMGIEEEFDIEIPTEEAEKIASVGDAVEAINRQGAENGRYLYRNTLDDTNVQVDYGFGVAWDERRDLEDGGVDKVYDKHACRAASKTDELVYGNVLGVSERFLEDLKIFVELLESDE